MNQPPLTRTPNGDDAPQDHDIGVLLVVLVALSLFATAGLLAWDMTHPQPAVTHRTP